VNFIIQFHRIQTRTIHLVVLLYFDDQIIEMNSIFVCILQFGLQKHRFHLLYSRSDFYLNHKRNRYFSHDSIIHSHPYNVQLEADELKQKTKVFMINRCLELSNLFLFSTFSFHLSKILQFELFNNACSSKLCTKNTPCHPILKPKYIIYLSM
jgi:hypothetical protein